MRKAVRWVRDYPLTALMILCWIGGFIYFGSHGIYDRIEAWTARPRAVDVLADLPGLLKQEKVVPLFAPAPQNTDEIRKAREEQARQAEEERMRSPFSQVELSYLDDALFIGDSRTDTLRLYAGWDHVTYYTKVGTSIWSIMDDAVVPDPDSGGNISVEKALAKHHFGKVYIMLGVNELGTGTADSYYQQFKSVVKKIRELQPDAILFVQSIIHVSHAQDQEGTAINNEAIDARNKLLQKLADNKMVYYIDANEVLDDKDHCLNQDYTFDGVHLTADHVDVWKDYILAHGVVLAEPGGETQKETEASEKTQTEQAPETEKQTEKMPETEKQTEKAAESEKQTEKMTETETKKR